MIRFYWVTLVGVQRNRMPIERQMLRPALRRFQVGRKWDSTGNRCSDWSRYRLAKDLAILGLCFELRR